MPVTGQHTDFPVKEAVRYLMNVFLKQTRTEALAHWEIHYGKAWTDQVRKEFLKEWERKKKK